MLTHKETKGVYGCVDNVFDIQLPLLYFYCSEIVIGLKFVVQTLVLFHYYRMEDNKSLAEVTWRHVEHVKQVKHGGADQNGYECIVCVCMYVYMYVVCIYVCMCMYVYM